MTGKNSKTFALAPAFFVRLKRTILWTAGTVLPFSVAAGLLSGQKHDSGWGPTLFAGVFLAAILIPIIYWSYKKQVARWQTFRIEISNNHIRRTQDLVNDINLGASEISRIVRAPGRGLLIYAGRSGPAITIPETLEGFEDCCQLMQRFRPMEIRARKSFTMGMTILAGIVLASLYVAFDRSTDSWLVTALGCLIVVVAVLGVWRLQTSPEIDRRTKRSAWVIVLVCVQILSRVWSVWDEQRQIERAIQESHLLNLLVKARPDLRDRLRQALTLAARNRTKSNDGTYVNPATPIIAKVFPEYLSICSDEAIRRYARETVTLLEKLEAAPSDVCYDWLRPKGLHVPLGPVVGENGLDPLNEAMANVVETALQSPQAAPDAEDAEALSAKAMDGLRSGPGRDELEFRASDDPEFNKKRYCHTAEMIFRTYLNLPERQSSLVLRTVLSKSLRQH